MGRKGLFVAELTKTLRFYTDYHVEVQSNSGGGCNAVLWKLFISN